MKKFNKISSLRSGDTILTNDNLKEEEHIPFKLKIEKIINDKFGFIIEAINAILSII